MWRKEFDRMIDMMNSDIPNASHYYRTTKPAVYNTHFKEFISLCIEEIESYKPNQNQKAKNEKFYRIRD